MTKEEIVKRLIKIQVISHDTMTPTITRNIKSLIADLESETVEEVAKECDCQNCWLGKYQEGIKEPKSATRPKLPDCVKGKHDFKIDRVVVDNTIPYNPGVAFVICTSCGVIRKTQIDYLEENNGS